MDGEFIYASAAEEVCRARHVVERQFVDMRHHTRVNIHPELTLEVLAQSDTESRIRQRASFWARPR